MNLLSVLPLFTATLTLCGVAYSLLALWGARAFRRSIPLATAAADLPGVSILKPLRGVDPHMYAGFVSHCTQRYNGPFEILFGVSSLDDPAVAEVARLRIEYPHVPIHLIACPKRLGTNAKLSSLAQMLPHAKYEHIVVNDSDILVSPTYLVGITKPFLASSQNLHLTPGQKPASPNPPHGTDSQLENSTLETRQDPTFPQSAPVRPLGLVTVPYLGRAEGTFFSRLEALGISTDFIPGVLAARLLEGGLRFGLGSTLATTKTALASIGGFESLVDQLADDYELGARLSRNGYRVELIPEIVATTVPAYTFRSFADHQLRWSRSTRDSRRAGYFGLLFTYVLPWAFATLIASGFALWSVTLLSFALLVRLAVALDVGVGLLRDEQVFRDLVLLPVRDLFGLLFWAWSYAGDTVIWRGERFRLRRGILTRL